MFCKKFSQGERQEKRLCLRDVAEFCPYTSFVRVDIIPRDAEIGANLLLSESLPSQMEDFRFTGGKLGVLREPFEAARGFLAAFPGFEARMETVPLGDFLAGSTLCARREMVT
jgi:hypothetical protein